jgi:hypothetical protein
MYTTRMPGFSADASLYGSGTNYQVESLWGGLGQRREGGIQPAVPVQDEPGCSCMDLWGDGVNFYCKCRVDTGGGQYFSTWCDYNRKSGRLWCY